MVGLRLLRSLVPPYSLTLTLFMELTTQCGGAGSAGVGVLRAVAVEAAT